MAAKLLVSLNARRVRFASFERGSLSIVGEYDNDEQAWSAFGVWLNQHRNRPVYLMLDCIDEEYRTETLPHVRGRAQRDMLKRKLGQLFRTAPYRATWLQGREAGESKRLDDVYLFLALNSGEMLRPYLEHIRLLRAPLAGIYLLPQVSQVMAQKLKCNTPGALLLSSHASGLRQSFFYQGRLRISRLTPFDPVGDEALAAQYAAEIEKSRLYLYNSRQLPRDARLTVQVLDFENKLAALQQQLPQDPSSSCQCLSFAQVCTALGIPGDQLPPDSDALHLYLLGKQAPSVSLAAPQLTGDFSVYRLRLSLYAASAVVAVGALLWGGFNVYRGYANQNTTQELKSASVQYRAQYEAAAQHFPAAPVSAEKLRRAVEVAQQIQQLSRTPERFMQTVSKGLEEFPQIQLNRLNWKYSAAGEGGNQLAANWQQKGEVDAEIRPFTGDYRSALELIERFAAQLRRQQGVEEVTVAKLPVNLDPASTLRGSTQDNAEARTGAAQFQLNIVLKRGL